MCDLTPVLPAWLVAPPAAPPTSLSASPVLLELSQVVQAAHSALLPVLPAPQSPTARPALRTISFRATSASPSVPSPAPPAIQTTSVLPVSVDTLYRAQSAILTPPVTLLPPALLALSVTPSLAASAQNAPPVTASVVTVLLLPPVNFAQMVTSSTSSTPAALTALPVALPVLPVSTPRPAPPAPQATTCRLSTIWLLESAWPAALPVSPAPTVPPSVLPVLQDTHLTAPSASPPKASLSATSSPPRLPRPQRLNLPPS